MPRLATADLRAERARIRVAPARLSELAGAVAAASPDRRGPIMRAP